MPVLGPDTTYTRAQARRLLGISEAQLRGWENKRLIPAQQNYNLSDLLALKTLHKLSRSRLSAAQIQAVLAAVREKVGELEEPLKQLRILREGRRITVVIGGQKMEPLSGQLLLDFGGEELARLLDFPRLPSPASHSRAREAEQWFENGLALEQQGAPTEQIVEAYQRAIELDPRSVGAMVNLGTLYYHRRRWAEAEYWYRRALEAEPGYALAHYNLGNLYDELDEADRAIEHYQQAIRLKPDYADAHYNLALLYQSTGQSMKAAHHWRTYLRLDPSSPWAAIARRQFEKLRKTTLVHGRQPPPPEEG